MAYWLGQVVVHVGVLQRKGHTSPQAPAPVEHVDGPEDADCRSLLVWVGEQRGIGFAAVQTEFEAVPCCEADHAPGKAFVVAGEVVHALD